MINKIMILGRLCADPEVKTTGSGTNCATFTIAVERDYKTASGTRETDFIPCIAWREKCDFISKYFHKGDMIAICGSLQSNKYTAQDGKQRTSFVVLIENASFTGGKAKAEAPQAEQTANFETLEDEEKLPF